MNNYITPVAKGCHTPNIQPQDTFIVAVFVLNVPFLNKED